MQGGYGAAFAKECEAVFCAGFTGRRVICYLKVQFSIKLLSVWKRKCRDKLFTLTVRVRCSGVFFTIVVQMKDLSPGRKPQKLKQRHIYIMVSEGACEGVAVCG